MKKLALLFVASLYVTASFAQVDFDATFHKKKISYIKGAVKDPAKAVKPATWISKGDIYFNTAEAPTKGLFKGMVATDIERICGVPTEKKTETINNIQYDVQVFPNYDLYLPAGKNSVSFWIQKVEIAPNALDTAFYAYDKAVELDRKYLIKALPQFNKIIDIFKQEGELAFSAADYPRAATAFIKAYEYGQNPNVGINDTLLAYNGGYISILSKDYDNAVKYLETAKKLGFERDGEIFKLLFFAYDGKKDDASCAKVLEEGVAKYPGNAELVELLMNVYSRTGEDVSKLIPKVEASIAKDPKNFNLHFGLGLIYDKLKDFPNAIKEFTTATELSPKDYGSFFNLGVAYIRSGEELIPILNEIPASNQAEYNAKLVELNSFYKKALEPLEMAHSLKPDDRNAIELLKTFYFRFRDESPEMMTKYEKFNEMLKNM